MSLWAAVMLVFAGVPAHAAGVAPAVAAPAAPITREAAPDWVVPRNLPEANPTDVRQGIVYILTDAQTRIRPDGHDGWFRTASRVVERSGLEEAGRVSVEFDPAFETLAVHFIHVIRAGKVIDLTPETQFRVVEREADLDEGIVAGTLRAQANLRDVRVGDVIDFAYTVHTANTLWPGQFFDHFGERYSDPLALHMVRYVWPAGMAGQVRAHNSSVAFATRALGGGVEWEWSARDVPAQTGEDNVPDTAYQWGAVDVSTMRDWGQLAAVVTRLYDGDNSLPDDFIARLDAIAAAHPDKAVQASEVTRYLQDSIRYVGEEMGEGSYVPRRPRLVLQRGYGDCKDKSLLLAMALRHLGISAAPALVSTTRGQTLPERLPSPLMFDHVIVRAEVAGHVLWLDATGTHRGGQGLAMVPADFGYALPLVAGQAGLEPITGYADHAGRIAVLEQYAIDEKAEVPLHLHVVTTYTDARADVMRAHLAETSREALTKDFLDYYRKHLAGLVTEKPLQTTDDRDANRLQVIEDYALSRADFAKDKIADTLVVQAYLVADVLPDHEASPRRQPVAITANAVREHVIELRVKDRKLWTVDPLEEKAGGITFTRAATQDGELTRITYRLVTGPEKSVSAADAAAVFALSDKIKDVNGLEFYLTKSENLAEKSPDGLDRKLLETVQPEMGKVLELSKRGTDADLIEALSLLTAAGEKLPHPSPEAGLIDGMRGGLLAQLRRPGPALAALQAATAQFSGNPDVFRLWLIYAIDRGDPADLPRVLRRVAEAQPRQIVALAPEWVTAIQQKLRTLPADKRQKPLDDVCITLADGGFGLQPRTAQGSHILGCAIRAHAARGEWDAARKGIALNPGTSVLLSIGMDRRYQTLWPEIDRLGRDAFKASLEQDLARAEAAAKAAPEDFKLASARIDALRRLGRYDQALAVAEPLLAKRSRIETVGDDAFWLINDKATVLRSLGQIDAAIAALDQALSFGIDEYRSLAGIAINRAESLIAAGRHAEALAAMQDLEAKHNSLINDYGRMFVWGAQACALDALGRGDESRAVAAKMAPKSDESPMAMLQLHACRKDDAAVKALLITILRDPNFRTEALALFVRPKSRSAAQPFQAQVRARVLAALDDPEVQAEFRKIGRTMDYAGTDTGVSF